jgi:hypothetical protein
MTNAGITPTTFNARIVAPRFFFGMTCGREEMKRYMQFRAQLRKLPVVFSIEEVSDLLMAAPGPGFKYRAALSISYGGGLRTAEVCTLKVGDIESDRMLIHDEQGKAQHCLSGHDARTCRKERCRGGWLTLLRLSAAALLRMRIAKVGRPTRQPPGWIQSRLSALVVPQSLGRRRRLFEIDIIGRIAPFSRPPARCRPAASSSGLGDAANLNERGATRPMGSDQQALVLVAEHLLRDVFGAPRSHRSCDALPTAQQWKCCRTGKLGLLRQSEGVDL